MKKRGLILCVSLGLILTGCGTNEQVVWPKASVETETEKSTDNTHAAGNSVTLTNGEYSEEELDASWNEGNAVLITLQQDTAEIQGSGAAADGGNIMITAAGTYVITGTLEGGNITVNVGNGDVRLILNGVDITASNSPGIDILQGDVIITLAESTENTISDGESTDSNTEERNNAAIYAKDDLVFNGSGSLTVNGNYKNGIQGKDDLKFVSGNYTITAAHHGIIGKDCVQIKDGTYEISAKGDGIQASNTEAADQGYILLDGGNYTITAENDAIQAETLLRINGGEYSLVTGGGSENAVQTQSGSRPDGGMGREDGMPRGRGNMDQQGEMAKMAEGIADQDSTDTESMKGLKSYVDLVITGGTFQIDACDDGIHSNSDVTIEAGNIRISAGDDGVHADKALVIKEGTIQIDTSYEGLEGYTIAVDGGDIQVNANDDGINAAQGSSETNGAEPRMGESQGAVLAVNGGNIYVDAGGDGLDANGRIEMTGGTVEVQGPVMGGNGALDFDEDFVLTGGTLLSAGSPEMIQELDSASTQGFVTESLNTNMAVGTIITVLDEAGNELTSMTAKKAAGWYLISAAGIESGNTYTVKIGDEVREVTAK